jgi:hypothetical protein
LNTSISFVPRPYSHSGNAHNSVMMMHLLHQAIALNNTGIMSHQQGHCGLATFECAIATLRILSEQVAAASKSLSTPSSNRPALGSSTFGVVPCSLDKTGQRDRINGSHFVYNRPLLLLTVYSVSGIDALLAIVLTASTTMIFNMAVQWHELGRATGRGVYETKASRLYDAILSILDSVCHSVDDESLALLKCLTLNNRAHLYHEQCEYVHSDRCMDKLCHLLVSTDVLDDYLDEADADEIRMNSIYLQPPTVAHAA